MDSIFNILKDCIPSDYCAQVHSRSVLEMWMRRRRFSRALDLGYGDGRSVDVFRKAQPEIDWTGIDIESSPEVNSRKRQDAKFVTFDGIHIPFDSGHFEIIYSHQVFEHVRHPESLLRDVARVLSDDGLFIGSTSQFEPYHSFSFWNYTIYGFYTLLRECGFQVLELRPGIDGITLIERARRGRPPEYSKYFFEESPINSEIEKEIRGKRPNNIVNFRKLMYCGQFIFVAKRR